MSGNINGPINGNNHFFSVKPKIIPEAWSSNSYTINQEKERNPYAHVALCIKEKFGNSYKDIPDEKFQEVVDYINFLKENPS